MSGVAAIPKGRSDDTHRVTCHRHSIRISLQNAVTCTRKHSFLRVALPFTGSIFCFRLIPRKSFISCSIEPVSSILVRYGRWGLGVCPSALQCTSHVAAVCNTHDRHPSSAVHLPFGHCCFGIWTCECGGPFFYYHGFGSAAPSIADWMIPVCALIDVVK